VANKPEDYTDQDIQQLSVFLSNTQIIINQKQAEEKHLELESQLRQKYKMEAVGVMAGGMAHNFNNNLAIILGNLELSKVKLPPQSEVGKYLEYARIASLRSRDLVKQIMTYSRKDSQPQAPLQLSLLLKETVSLLKSTIPSSVKLAQEVSPDCENTYILADASQIQECILNLCNNAVHAMNERGELLLGLRRAELKQTDITARYDCSPGEYLCLSVQDNGCGIPAEIQEKIFDPFFTTKELYEGTGMGLSTVQGIIEQHHGMITVKSSLGQETIFNLYFPVADQPKKEVTRDAEAEIQRGTERILFIDDDQMVANLNELMLTELGYQVAVVTDSVEALKLFSTNVDNFDLIITDQTMPELTGKELIQKIKKLRPEIPTILCTGYSSKINEEEARQLGISAFLMKPTDFTEMSQVIRTVLEKSLAH
jgi:signal transduction histidine kinase/CheY-like chemotaxis protein